MKFTAFAVLLVVGSCAPAVRPDPGEEIEDKMIGFLEKFDRFDLNGDGYLTREEILTGAREAEFDPIDPRKLERAFAFYDTNNDGRILLAEAEAGLKRGPGAPGPGLRRPDQVLH